MIRWSNLAVLSLVAISSVAFAQSPTPSASASPTASASPSPSGSASPTALNSVENTYVLNQLHYFNQKQIEVGQQVSSLAITPTSKAYASQMVTTYQALDEKVTTLATQKNITLAPFQLSSADQAAQQSLAVLSPADFDVAFFAAVNVEHQTALAYLNAVKPYVQDPDVTALLTAAVPVIQSQQRMAAAGGTGGASPQPSSSPSAEPSGGPSAQPSLR